MARQVPAGPYAAGLLCHEAKLIVEADGPTHEDPERESLGEGRDAWLKGHGFRVLRFSNDLALVGTEILVGQIEAALKAGPPS